MTDPQDRLSLEANLEVDFRRTLGHFCSGIVVVTGSDADGRPVGLTCQSFFSLSLDPPLVAFSPSRGSGTYAALRSSGAFCINILEETQQPLCAAFARRDIDRWQGVEWTAGSTGSPILAGVLAWIDCRLEIEHETGDHYLVIGRIADMGTADAADSRPLVYYKGMYSSLHPTPAA